MSHFKKALAFVLRMEGGFVNDPADPGGATNMGITQKVYDKYRDAMHQTKSRRSVELIDPMEVEWIYYHWYWNRAKCRSIAEISPALAIAHMDWAVNTGPARACRQLQDVVGATVDGVIGPLTLGHIRVAVREDRAIPNYLFKRLDFYVEIVKRRPTSKVFLSGWVWRVVELAKHIGSY
jgi:lysozyme family protein